MIDAIWLAIVIARLSTMMPAFCEIEDFLLGEVCDTNLFQELLGVQISFYVVYDGNISPRRGF